MHRDDPRPQVAAEGHRQGCLSQAGLGPGRLRASQQGIRAQPGARIFTSRLKRLRRPPGGCKNVPKRTGETMVPQAGGPGKLRMSVEFAGGPARTNFGIAYAVHRSMQGAITGRDVLVHSVTILRLWGPGFYVRCLRALASRRRCTFLDVLASER